MLQCEKDEEIQSIQETLKSENFVQIKKMQKNLPKLTIFDIGEFDTADDLKTSIISKNPRIKELVDNCKTFDVLFFKKLTNSVSVVVKVDPEIRQCVLQNKSKMYVGLKSCNVSDSFPFKICYNCQATCSHHIKDCTLKDKSICRYCSENHSSKNCVVKNDTTKHICINCSNSNVAKIKNNCHSHHSNSNSCPLIESIISNIKANTCYTAEQKNLSAPPL